MASNEQKSVPKNPEAAKLCQKLDMAWHPAGFGWFKETFRSEIRVNRQNDNANRSGMTSIYFLQESDAIPRWRRLKSDELFCWLKGSPMKVYVLNPNNGQLDTVVLGDVLETKGDVPVDQFQHTITAGCYFNTEVLGEDYTLVAAIVAPGFEFEDFECPEQSELNKTFPKHEGLIDRFF